MKFLILTVLFIVFASSLAFTDPIISSNNLGKPNHRTGRVKDFFQWNQKVRFSFFDHFVVEVSEIGFPVQVFYQLDPLGGRDDCPIPLDEISGIFFQ
uniref:Uncharacterized protein n=1 Tax=Caenorhabditis tropicalis TaxID=1561998 RepID=A0A1I7T6C6_9PELO